MEGSGITQVKLEQIGPITGVERTRNVRYLRVYCASTRKTRKYGTKVCGTGVTGRIIPPAQNIPGYKIA